MKPVWKGFWQSWQNVSFYLHFWVCKVITLVCLLVWTNYQNNFTKLSFNCHNFKVTQFANDYFAFKIHGEILDVSEWQNCAKYWKFNRWGINCGQKYSNRPSSAQHRLLNTKVIIIIPLGMPTLCLYLLHTFSLILPKFYFVSSFYANVHAKMKIHFPKV